MGSEKRKKNRKRKSLLVRCTESQSMAASLLLRALPLLRLHLVQHHHHFRLYEGLIARRTFCSAGADSGGPDGDNSPSLTQIFSSETVKDPPHYPRLDDPDFRKWQDKETKILEDIEPIIYLTKEILHSNRCPLISLLQFELFAWTVLVFACCLNSCVNDGIIGLWASFVRYLLRFD